MLDQETKRRIDSCRNMLVGKIPDPKSQVEQITIALIYKFMDDMDNEAVEMGGKASFFTGDYAKYSWTAIFDPRIGGHDLLKLYGEALEKMNQNPNIPQLFRNIFNNAYLPYRDPETLKLFLKEIDNFSYSHSEKLGDAFEYLLSFMGTQGDAGQFRTPRHIIDFIAEVVDPKKNETVLDPACGTAGFMISAYKHILKNNDGGKNLTPDERKRLINNFIGYDISPDISMQEIQEASPEEIDESLIKLSEETDGTIGENKIVSMLDNMTIKDSVKSFDEQIQTLNTEIQGRREDSSNIDNQKRMIQTKQSSGISISESEEQFLNRTKELKALGEAEMKNLNNEIQNLSKERKKYKLAEATEKLGKITSGGIYGMDYISY